MAKYYVDTSIWRDLHENRRDNLRPLGEWAFEMFRMIRINKDTVLYSDSVMEELLRYYTQAEANDILHISADYEILQRINTTDEQIKEAVVLSRTLKIPSGDCLHAVLARDAKAVMVTRDAHFEQLRFIADVKKPEELI